MRLFVTGASGFLGTAVLSAARSAGHEVVALARQRPASADPLVQWSLGDVRKPGDWTASMAGCDVVVHLAASMSGDADQQWSVAVDGTRTVVEAMSEVGVDHLVLSSSLAVYDLAALADDAVVDEDTLLEVDADRRDGYTRAKLAQEAIAADAPRCSVLRPGLIWDRDHHWNGGHVLTVGRRLGVMIARSGALPLTHVANCADAFVAAAEPSRAGVVANIIDDPCPSRAEFATALRAAGVPIGVSVPLSWTVAHRVARLASGTATPLGVGDRLPGLLKPAQLAARCKPVQYRNDRARRELGWEPRIGLHDTLAGYPSR